MAIQIKKGNLLNAKGIIVHGCNCQGVMGSGVAKAIKEKWPEAYRAYRAVWSRDGLVLGDINSIPVAVDVLVVNAITQQYYGQGIRHVSYDAVADCFKKIDRLAREIKRPVNFPLLGAGLGGGNWDIISNIIDCTLGDDIEKILWVQQ